ncbi:MAG: FAD/NAD(P)-binding protein, partial [Bacteroidia bacterium]
SISSLASTHHAFQNNPWHFNTHTNPDTTILLLGAGLTMIDQLLHLQALEHHGKIVSLSPHGFLPLAHPTFPQKWPLDESLMQVQRSPLEWFRFFREQTKRAEAERYDVFAVADGFRPYTQAIWQSWNKAEREAFRQHLRHRWAQVRHRLPLKVAKKIEALKTSGQLHIHAGRLLDVSPSAEKLLVRWQLRGTKEVHEILIDSFINCTGPSSRFETDGSPLLKNLLANKILVQDEQQLGFSATATGALKKIDGTTYSNAFALGGLLRGTLWEITAVPDIRKHIGQVIDLLVSK